MTIGEKIKKLRLKKKMTIKELSEKSGLSQVIISHYEHGSVVPSLTNIQKLSVGLDCDFEDLYKTTLTKGTKWN